MALFSLILAGMMSMLLVESGRSPLESRQRPHLIIERYNYRTMESNEETSRLSSVVLEGARQALRECKRQFKDNIWNCSISDEQNPKGVPLFLNTKLPFVTREMAFVQAIGSAAIALEFARNCEKIKLSRRNSQCKDTVEFGQKRARLFLDKLESGNEAYSAVNRHNNRVGREVIRALAGRMNLKWKRPGILRFEDVGAKLKEKYLNATRVWFVNNTLQERVEHDQLRAISHDDNRLVYLDPSPDYCVPNNTLGSLGMLGRTCKHYDAQETRCQSFIDKCNSCKLKYKTVAYEVEEYRCNCNFHWCCYVKCKTCKRVPYITTCTENEKFTGYY